MGGQKGEIDQPNQTMHAMSLGQVVSMLALYTDDPISNPAEACKMLFEKDENKNWLKGGSPGLVVMGGDSCSEVVSLNPGNIYWMNIFSHTFLL